MHVLSLKTANKLFLSISDDPYSRLFRGCNSFRCYCVELVKLLPVQQYSVDIFSYSGPSGILGSDRKQNTA